MHRIRRIAAALTAGATITTGAVVTAAAPAHAATSFSCIAAYASAQAPGAKFPTFLFAANPRFTPCAPDTKAVDIPQDFVGLIEFDARIVDAHTVHDSNNPGYINSGGFDEIQEGVLKIGGVEIGHFWGAKSSAQVAFATGDACGLIDEESSSIDDITILGLHLVGLTGPQSFGVPGMPGYQLLVNQRGAATSGDGRTILATAAPIVVKQPNGTTVAFGISEASASC